MKYKASDVFALDILKSANYSNFNVLAFVSLTSEQAKEPLFTTIIDKQWVLKATSSDQIFLKTSLNDNCKTRYMCKEWVQIGSTNY